MSAITLPGGKENEVSEARWSAVFAMAVAVGVIMLAEFLPAGILTPLASDMQITVGMAGQTITFASAAAVVASLLLASLTAKLNRRLVLLALSVMLVVSNLIVALAPTFPILLFGRILLGISLGGVWGMVAAITMRLVPRNLVPKALSIIFSVSSIAVVVAAPLGSYLGHLVGWRNVFLIATFISAIGFAWQYFSLPSLEPIRQTTLGSIIDVFRKPQFALGIVAAIFGFCGRFASLTYMRPFLERTTGVGVDGLSLILLIFGLSYFAGNALAAWFIQRSLRLTLALLPILLVFTALGLIAWGESVIATTLLLVILGAGFGPVPVGWSAFVVQKVPHLAEIGGGVVVAATQSAFALGALLGGLVFDSTGSTGVFLLSSVSWLIAGGIVLWSVTDSERVAPQ